MVFLWFWCLLVIVVRLLRLRDVLLNIFQEDAAVLARPVNRGKFVVRDTGLVRLLEGPGGDVEFVIVLGFVTSEPLLNILEQDAAVLARTGLTNERQLVLVCQVQGIGRDQKLGLCRFLEGLLDILESPLAVLTRPLTLCHDPVLCCKFLSPLACPGRLVLVNLGDELLREKFLLCKECQGVVVLELVLAGEHLQDVRESVSRGSHEFARGSVGCQQ